MTANTDGRRPRRTAAVIIGVLVLVIAVVVVVALLTAGKPSSGSTTPSPGSSTSAPADVATPPAVVTPSAEPTSSGSATASAEPTAQPTRTATISEPTAVPIKKELAASVVKMEAVTGKADGPGEIGGPSVRFTIKISNTTGKAFSLTNTVVNAYYGKDASPAVQLREPGGKDFPASVKNGASATGVFVFNIPKADRGTVKITVDTSVQNPVIAFEGSAPRG